MKKSTAFYLTILIMIAAHGVGVYFIIIGQYIPALPSYLFLMLAANKFARMHGLHLNHKQ